MAQLTERKNLNGGELHKELIKEVSVNVNRFIQEKITSLNLPADIITHNKYLTALKKLGD